MFWDNISAEGQTGSSMGKNVDTRKYFFPLQFLIILCLPEYGCWFANPEGAALLFPPVHTWRTMEYNWKVAAGNLSWSTSYIAQSLLAILFI